MAAARTGSHIVSNPLHSSFFGDWTGTGWRCAHARQSPVHFVRPALGFPPGQARAGARLIDGTAARSGTTDFPIRPSFQEHRLYGHSRTAAAHAPRKPPVR